MCPLVPRPLFEYSSTGADGALGRKRFSYRELSMGRMFVWCASLALFCRVSSAGAQDHEQPVEHQASPTTPPPVVAQAVAPSPKPASPAPLVIEVRGERRPVD